MNYEKEIVPPAAGRVLRLPLSRLRAGDTVRALYLLHVKEGERGFECAEGLKAADYTHTPAGTPVDLFATSDEIFVLYAASSGTRYLFGLENGRNYSDMPAGDVQRIAPVTPRLDYPLPQTWYVVTPDHTWRCCAYEASKDFSNGQGGFFGTEYAGRFFLLDGRRLTYTAPYDESEWEYTENGQLQQFGYIEIPPRCGEYVDGAVFDERLFLFGRTGVVEVVMGGKTLNGKTRYLPQQVGETIKGTVQTIADKAYFFTEKGLCLFDGENFRRVASPCSRRIDFSCAFKTGVWRGRYYAFVALDTGERRIYVYDPETERETYLREEVDAFCAGKRALAVKNGAFYTLADRILPANGDPCSVCVKLAVNEGRSARIDWVRIEGEGQFEVEASTPEDGAARARGSAGARLPLTRSLFGAELSLTISTRDADFLLTGIAVGMGEGTDDD